MTEDKEDINDLYQRPVLHPEPAGTVSLRRRLRRWLPRVIQGDAEGVATPAQPELTNRLLAASETARRRLSAELHDRTSPNLAAIDINLALIADELRDLHRPSLSDRLADTRALLKDTSASIRDICTDLRPPLLDYAGLPSALAAHVRQFARRTGVAAGFTCTAPERRLSPDTESLLFRIVQEALTNCAKHAAAHTVDVRLDNAADPVTLDIADDGNGFDPDRLGQPGHSIGLGLLNMREMAELAGGEFHLDSRPGEGTRIGVVLPG